MKTLDHLPRFLFVTGKGIADPASNADHVFSIRNSKQVTAVGKPPSVSALEINLQTVVQARHHRSAGPGWGGLPDERGGVERLLELSGHSMARTDAPALESA